MTSKIVKVKSLVFYKEKLDSREKGNGRVAKNQMSRPELKGVSEVLALLLF